MTDRAWAVTALAAVLMVVLGLVMDLLGLRLPGGAGVFGVLAAMVVGTTAVQSRRRWPPTS